MTDLNDATVTPDEFLDVFDQWISGATLGQRSIEIYANPGLFAQYEQLERELKVAEAEGDNAEASLGDSRVADIEDQLANLYDQWMASKSTWYIRALPKPVAKTLSKAHPEVAVPDELPADADEAATARHAQLVEAYEQRADARNYAILEQTVVCIEFADGKKLEPVYKPDGVHVETPAVTASQLAQLRVNLGDVQLIKLIQAGKAALVSEPVIPAPFLRASSKNGRTSN